MQIPVKFIHDGKEYTGHFKKVSGAGGAGTYHLMIDGFYKGQLNYTEIHGWQFTSQNMILAYKSDEFGKVIMDWNKKLL